MALAYEHISSNRKKTWVMVALFPICFGVLAYLAVLLYYWLTLNASSPKQLAAMTQMAYPANPLLYYTYEITIYAVPVVAMAAILWLVLSYFHGASTILNNAHATEISMHNNRQLYRLVENLCITRGLPLPKIYVIDDASLNAFATGRNPANAIIAVTSGLLEKLDKPELQGVLAHELSHIENRDTTLLLLAIEGIAFCTFFGEVLLRMGRTAMRSRDGAKFGLIIFLAALVFVIFGYIIAPLLRFAMSRQREYLADASAALMTRNPGALADALEKIRNDPRVEILDDHPSMAAMCIYAPGEIEASFFNKISGLYATHPPVAERIKRLRQMDNMR